MEKVKEWSKSIGVFLIYYILPSACVIILFGLTKEKNVYLNNLALFLSEFIPILVFAIIFRKALKKDWKDFKENFKTKIPFALKCWGLGLLAMIISNAIINFIILKGNIAANEETNRTILEMYPYYAVTSILFFAPFIEELAYRCNFKKLFKKAIPFAIFTGLLFGSMHVITTFETWSDFLNNWTQLLYLIPYSSLGFAFGYAYYKNDNIYTSMFVHFLHNALSLVLIMMSFLAGI